MTLVSVSRGWRLIADGLLAVVMAVVMVTAAATSGDEPARPLDGWVIAAIGVLGAWAGLARHAPRVTIVCSGLSFYAALALGVPGFSPALALGVPVFVAALFGHLWWSVAMLAVITATSAPYRLLASGAEPFSQVVVNTVFDLALVALLLLLGETLRSRRALRRESELLLLLAEQEHQRRLTTERLRVTSDLHDVLSHTVALVGIQANVAAESIEADPEEARDAIARVREATREAAADLRSTIAVLREECPEAAVDPAPGVEQLPALAESFRTSGVVPTLTVTGTTRRLRPAIDLAVYRVAQESLTNVLRHAGATAVDIAVDYGADSVAVTVRDNGTRLAPRGGAGTMPGGGSGLRGMAERVEALAGRLEHGPRDDGAAGYQVRACIPLGGAT